MEAEIKKDFIETMRMHNNCTIMEARLLWMKHGEQYLDKIYEHMADEVVAIINLEEKDK